MKLNRARALSTVRRLQRKFLRQPQSNERSNQAGRVHNTNPEGKDRPHNTSHDSDQGEATTNSKQREESRHRTPHKREETRQERQRTDQPPQADAQTEARGSPKEARGDKQTLLILFHTQRNSTP